METEKRPASRPHEDLEQMRRRVAELEALEHEKSCYRAVIERHSQEMAIIAEIGMLVSSTLEIDTIYERLVAATQKLIPTDLFSIHLQTPDPENFVIAYATGVDIPGRQAGDLVPVRGSLLEIVRAARKGLLFAANSAEEMATQSPSVSDTIFRAGIRSMIVAPMISQDVMIGSLYFRSKRFNAYTDRDRQLAERIGEQIAGAIANAQLYNRLRETEISLRKTLEELERRVQERTFELQEVNTALRILLKKRDEDHIRIGEQLQANVRHLVIPFLNKLKAVRSDQQGLAYLRVLETNLDNITSPFVNHLSVAYKKLTPKEIQVAALVRQGKKSNEIAKILGCSIGTVITHRNNIRKKLKLTNNHANLRSLLLSMQ